MNHFDGPADELMNRLNLDKHLEFSDPFITHLANSYLLSGTNPDPNVKHFVAMRIKTTFLNEFGDVVFVKLLKDKARTDSLWLSGMQKHIVNDVYLIKDDLENQHVGIVYNMNNDPSFATFLGFLEPESELYSKTIDKLRNYNGQ